MTKLTNPQIEMLRDATRRPQRVVRGYKPAEKLAALGLVEVVIAEGAFAWIVSTTTAGRIAFSASQGGESV